MPKETKCDCDESYLVGIEYTYDEPNHYDGVSEWKCSKCGKRVGRWSNQELTGIETESPFDKIKP